MILEFDRTRCILVWYHIYFYIVKAFVNIDDIGYVVHKTYSGTEDAAARKIRH